jgi:hypothetical protein
MKLSVLALCEHVFVIELKQANPGDQGSIGEAVAASWLTQTGYSVWIPFGHSPDPASKGTVVGRDLHSRRQPKLEQGDQET